MDQLGQTEKGEQLIREALAIAVKIGDVRGEGNRTGHLGGLLFKKAQGLPPGAERASILHGARDQISLAVSRAQETGDAEKEASWLMNLGSISCLEENDEAGINNYYESLAIAEARGFQKIEAQARFNLGLALPPLGRLQEALNHFIKSKNLLLNTNSPMAMKTNAYISKLTTMLSELKTL